MAGLLPSVDNVIYAASRYAVRGPGGLVATPARAPHGIGVSTLYPGLTRSRMLLAEQDRQEQFGAGRAALPVGQEVGADRLMPQAMICERTDAARAAVDRMNDRDSSEAPS